MNKNMNKDRKAKLYLRDRVRELLDAYLMHPDEAFCEVTLTFRKKNGEEQKKHLRWVAEEEKAEDIEQDRKEHENHDRKQHEALRKG